VGNEQWGPRYLERYKIFADALKTKHPEIELVVSAGPSPSGEEFERLWAHWREVSADIVDEHYYMSPDWFLQNSGRYDHYPRQGPKIFAGEYAAQTSGVAKPDNRNNWEAALAEAAFMTGLQRNGDLVRMASYAPLLAHVEAWQWTPDAIWFDNLHSYATPNFYVQGLFAKNAGSQIVPATPEMQGGLYTSASRDERTGEIIVIAVNTTSQARTSEIQLKGVEVKGTIKVTTLSSEDLKAENSLEKPTNISPVLSELDAHRDRIPVTLKPHSVNALRIPVQ
jgi:alpha-L-arabinofuranosidase